jgi:hypothetical protein
MPPPHHPPGQRVGAGGGVAALQERVGERVGRRALHSLCAQHRPLRRGRGHVHVRARGARAVRQRVAADARELRAARDGARGGHPPHAGGAAKKVVAGAVGHGACSGRGAAVGDHSACRVDVARHQRHDAHGAVGADAHDSLVDAGGDRRAGRQRQARERQRAAVGRPRQHAAGDGHRVDGTARGDDRAVGVHHRGARGQRDGLRGRAEGGGGGGARQQGW